MAGLFRRTPVLLDPEQLPAGFAYPPGLHQLIKDTPLRNWEWLSGERLRKASHNFWKHHPRHLVPFAVRRDTTYVVCFDHATVGPEGHEVVTVDALDAEAAPVQHLPTLRQWLDAALEEEIGPQVAPGSAVPGDAPGLPPGASWEPPETGACSCVHHLEAFLATVVPYTRSVPPDRPPRTVGDLLMAREVVAEPDFPGPALAWRNRPVGPFHWRVSLVAGARQHFDDDGRLSLEALIQPNPGVGLVVRPEGRDFHLNAPTMCRDGIQTLFVRAMLDPRARRK